MVRTHSYTSIHLLSLTKLNFCIFEIITKTYLQDYIELAIQFGFAVLFSCAFPLAPLFAFLNNIFEIRIDAAKYVKYSQRPIPERTKNIGIWYPIFRFLAILAVITNVTIQVFLLGIKLMFRACS